MRKQLFLLVLIIIMTTACSSTPKFSSVTGKEWKLIEVHVTEVLTGAEDTSRINERDILFDRKTLTNEDAGDYFIFNIDDENISGTGAPNRYTGPYTLGDSQAISLSPERSTTIPPLKQPEKLREQDFFIYMQNVYKWNLVNKKLELYSKTEDDTEVRMVFSL